MPVTFSKVRFDYTRAIPRASENLAAFRRARQRVAADMTAELKALVSKPYPPPSKPGQPPHRRTGRLRESIQVRAVGENGIGFNWGELAEHASYLEFGTVNMAPRPYIHPVFGGRGQRQKWTARTAQYMREELAKSRRRG